MAAKRRGKGRPFLKGESGNPQGSSSRKRNLAEISRLSNKQVEEVGSLILNGDRERLKTLGNDPKASVLQVWMAGLVVNSMKTGCPQTFNVIMSRLCGKPRETVELSGRDGKPMSMEVASREMTEAEMRERADALAKQRMEAGDD